MAREIKRPAVIKESELKEQVAPAEVSLPVAETPVPPEQVKIKAVEEAIAAASAPQGPALISFGTWFQKLASKNPKIKTQYKEAILAHCKAVGIAEHATEGEFNAALKHFGL
jgi:hypothetical protein